MRHGRSTVWKLWGMPQAINVGDALFTLAHLSLLDLEGSIPAESVLRAARLLQETCLSLTKGQFLDIAYEARGDLDLEAYWPMVSGKTAALAGDLHRIGAINCWSGCGVLRGLSRVRPLIGIGISGPR